jgi:hypothetical protein
MAVLQTGNSTVGNANVDAGFNLNTSPSVVPNYIGGIRLFTLADDGSISNQVDGNWLAGDDYGRMNCGADTLLDTETFNYTAQNTGKHTYVNTTMTAAWTVGALQTNSGSITTINTGLTFGTYAAWPIIGASYSVCEVEGGFSAAIATNTTIDFGFFQRAAATPYAPTDGVYFRITSAGMVGVINYNGVETSTGTFTNAGAVGTWTPNVNQKYRFEIYVNRRDCDFYIDGERYATLNTQVGQGQPFASATLPFSVRHAIGGAAASGVTQFLVADYTIRLGGSNLVRTLGEFGNAGYGSYQGLSGGTMGSLANYANSANPTAAVPTNTTAALGTGLGGQFWETFSLAVNTDGIIWSFLNPLGTVSVQGRRLKINALSLMSFVQTVLVGGPNVAQYSLAFGHTALSLATTESATAKAPRRIALPAFTQAVTAAEAVSTIISQPGGSIQAFQNPIYVNPGEYVALVVKRIGTVGTSGTIAHVSAADYSWE